MAVSRLSFASQVLSRASTIRGSVVYFRERRDDKTVLASVEFDGSEEIVHLESENATQIVPSPDGRWVAFVERFKVR